MFQQQRILSDLQTDKKMHTHTKWIAVSSVLFYAVKHLCLYFSVEIDSKRAEFALKTHLKCI